MVAAGNDGHEIGWLGSFQRFLVRQRQHERLTAEHLGGHRGDALHNPALAIEVVHHEDAVRLQHAADILKGLLGEQIALQADIGVARVQDQRVDQRIDDEVVFLFGRAQEVPSVIKVGHDTRVRIGLVRMMMDADVLDDRIDLHRVDALHAVAQRVRQIVAGAGADHHDIVKRRAAAALLQEVDQRIHRAALLEGDHLLMADIVDMDGAIFNVVVDGIIGRPADIVQLGRLGGNGGKRDDQQKRSATDRRQRAAPI